MLDAIIQEGRFRGWPLRAAMAIASGASPAFVKEALRKELRDRADEAWIDALPDIIELK